MVSLKDAQEKASNLKNATRRVVDHGLFYLLQRAVYSPDNLGHFGLNLDAYVHFTSPIRRYADLVVHRQLKSFLRGEEWVHSEDDILNISEQCRQFFAVFNVGHAKKFTFFQIFVAIFAVFNEICSDFFRANAKNAATSRNFSISSLI